MLEHRRSAVVPFRQQVWVVIVTDEEGHKIQERCSLRVEAEVDA